jgi:DMSO/TMAO reductase YedYZ molybdopterin-dependent catalytic subunit
LLESVDSDAGYVTAWCDGGYTTNLPLEDLTGGRAWIAYGYGGEPLEREHGDPARSWRRPRSHGGSPPSPT